MVRWTWVCIFALTGSLPELRAGRGRGSPTTTTPAPPLLPSPLDLTLPLDPNSTFWPSDQPFKFISNTSSYSDHGWISSQTTCSGGQVGTHMEAPYHFNDHGWKIDQIPLERLLTKGIMMDMTTDARSNGSLLLRGEHLIAWEKKHGQAQQQTVLIINFGWGQHHHHQLRTNTNNASAPVFPGISRGFAELVVACGSIVGVGVDTPALDPSHIQGSPAARTLMKANIYTLLNLDLSHHIPVKGFSLLILPTKIHGAGVATVRVVATPRSPAISRADRLNVSLQIIIVTISSFLALSLD